MSFSVWLLVCFWCVWFLLLPWFHFGSVRVEVALGSPAELCLQVLVQVHVPLLSYILSTAVGARYWHPFPDLDGAVARDMSSPSPLSTSSLMVEEEGPCALLLWQAQPGVHVDTTHRSGLAGAMLRHPREVNTAVFV